MKVRIDYTIEVGDDYRRAINMHFGKPGLATRNEVKSWIRTHGESADEDIMWHYQNSEETQETA